MAHFYRRGFTALVLPLLLFCTFALQAQQTTYRINYDISLLDLPGGIVQAPTGNFVFAGTNTSFIPISGTLTEVNSIGTVVWTKRYNALSLATDFQDIRAVSSGGYIVTGSNGSDLMLMRVDATGTVSWANTYQIPSTSSFGNRVLPTSDGGFVVAGGIYDADPDGSGPLARQDSSNMYCVKVDASGNLQWGNVFFISSTTIDDHSLADVAEVSDGYIFTGSVSETSGDGPTNAVLIKTNTSGVRQWSYRYGASNNSQTGSAIKRISGTEVLVAGEDNGGSYYLRVNSSGVVQSGNRYSFGFINTGFGTDIVLTNDGNYAMFGTYIGFGLPPVFSSFLVKINPSNGNLIFQKYYSPTSSSFFSISLLPEGIQAADSSYVMISTGFGSGTVSYDYELIKVDKNGLLNNSSCPEANLSLSRSGYNPTFTSFDPLLITNVATSGLTMVVTTPSTAATIACRTIACIRPAAPTTVTSTNNNFCPGTSTTINASGTGTNVTYNVYTVASNGTSIGTTPLTVSPATTTTYYVETEDNNNPGCVSSTRTSVTVTVLPATPAQPGTISGPNPACPGNQTYTISAVTNATSYTWSVSGGGTISGSGTSATVNWTTPGNWVISVTATNSCGTSTARTLSVTVSNPQPAQPGAITGSITPCPGSQGYSIAAVTNATSYTWSVSGGGTITGSGTSATVNWTTSGGPYTISVTASNSCGTSAPRTLTVNVQPGPPTTIGAISGPTSACVGSNAYSVPTVAGATTYTWSVSGGGTITGNGNSNVNINWTSPGTYTVSVIASNGCGSVTATPISVTVVGAPPATPGPITGTNNACTGNQTYTIPAVPNASSYTWSISGGGTVVSGANTTSFTVNWTTAGTHNVSVTATNACGTSSAATLQVVVNTTVPPTAGAITGQTSVCTGNQTYGIAAVAGATGYTWAVSGGGTITGNGTSATVNWTTPGGPYTVSVTATNACGNATSASTLQVTVLPANPAAPASITGNTPVCFGAQNYTAAAVSGASSYNWSVNGGGTIASGQGTATVGINWTTAGTWTISVTATSICGVSQPTTYTVEVLPANPPTPGTISGNSPACPGTEAYSVAAVAGASSYTWSVSGGGTITGGQTTANVSIAWVTPGTWTVSVTANNQCGNSTPATRQVTVLPSNPGNASAITGNINACPATSETYSIITMPDASGYTWTVSGGGTITGNGASATVNWTTSGGPYTITVVPFNQCGNGGASTLDVTVLPASPPAPANITGNTPVCFGSETYTAAAVTGATGYTWSVSGGGTIGTNGNQSVSINWTTAGTWTVSVTAQNQCGSSTATTYSVEVLPANPATPGNITGPTAVCPGTQTYSIPAVPGASSYTWSVGTGGTIVSGQGTNSIDVDWASVSGSFNVSVVASNQCGNSQPSTIQVTIVPGPPTGTPVISGAAGPCPGTQTYTVSGVTGAAGYNWTLTGGGTIQTGQGTASITIDWTTTGGPYTIEVTPNNSCGNGTASTFDVTVDGPPVIGAAAITGNNNPCPGSETYTVSSVPNATGYTWTVSGGGTITGNGTTATVNWTTSGGPYTISVTATNTCGSSSPATFTVNVQPGIPSAPTAITGPNSVCQGSGTANYSVGAVTNATDYQWTVSSGGGTVTAGQGTTNATIDWTGVPGNYTVSVTAGNACGTSAATTFNVTITPGAPAQPGNISGQASVCPGIESYNVAAVANATGYSWTVSGGGTVATGAGTNSITINWTTSGGPYLVSVVATNGCGNSTAQTINVTVNPSPTAPTIITSGDTICEGQSASITATNSTGGSNITYNIFDSQTGGSLLGVSPLTVNPTVTTTYYVEVVNDLGCRYSGGRVPVTIVVLPAPSAPVIQGSDHGVCFNESTTLTATSSSGSTITWWNAQVGGTQLGTGNSFVTGNLTSSTTFFVQATSANGCGSLMARIAVPVTVAPQPTVTLTTDAANNSIFINQALIATAEPGTYTWYEWFLNGVSVQRDSINTWRSSALNDGDVISVIATNGGCIGEEVEIAIEVTDFPNVFTPNGDGRNDFFLDGFDLVIINRWGQELFTGKTGWDGTFNGEPVSPGTYFYVVRVPDITNKEKVLTGSVLVHY